MLKSLARKKWNFTTAAHLLNRAGSGGTPAEIEHLASLDRTQAVNQLVNYEAIPDTTALIPDWAKPDPTREERFRKARDMIRPREAAADDPGRTKAATSANAAWN